MRVSYERKTRQRFSTLHIVVGASCIGSFALLPCIFLIKSAYFVALSAIYMAAAFMPALSH